MRYTCGIDIGASSSKLVILDENSNAVGKALQRSGVNYGQTADDCLDMALAMAGLKREDIGRSVSTGYGRHNVPWADNTSTEIACHGEGAYFHFPQALTIIDIGAQDSKVIHLDDQGRRTSFKMNRKCAAGTGAFIEEIAYRLAIPLKDLDGLAAASTKKTSLGSFCTVFAATEVLEKIRAGEQAEDIVRGAFESVVKRIVEMDGATGALALTGGVVAHNPKLAKMIGEAFATEPLVPPDPQFTGAFGAALLARKQN